MSDFLTRLLEDRDLVEAPVGIGERWPVVRTGQREPIHPTTRRLIYQRDRHTCCFCAKRMWKLVLDHIIPWSAGGPDTSGNLRSLCYRCNKERSNYRTELDYPAIPVTLACDECIRGWVRNYGVCRFGRCLPGEPEIVAFCGNCRSFSTVTDPGRLK